MQFIEMIFYFLFFVIHFNFAGNKTQANLTNPMLSFKSVNSINFNFYGLHQPITHELFGGKPFLQ